MTLQTGAVIGKKSVLWTDSAAWDEATGEVFGMTAKAFGGGWWAGTKSFWGRDARFIGPQIDAANPQSLPDLLEVSASALRQYALMGGGGRIMLGSYWQGKAQLHMIATDELFPGSGYGPFDPVEVDYYVSSANETTAVKMVHKKGPTMARMERVIEAQRVTPFSSASGPLAALPPRVWIGGPIISLNVGAQGVDIWEYDSEPIPA